MKRPALFLLIGYISGILIYVNRKSFAVYLILFLFWLIVIFDTKPEKRIRVLIFMVIPLVIGFIYSAYTFRRLYPDNLNQYDGRYTEGYAVVKNIKEKSETNLIIAKVKSMEEATMNVTVTMEVPKDEDVLPGDLIRFYGTLSIPTGQRNPGNFNSLHYMASKKHGAKINGGGLIVMQKSFKKRPIIKGAIAVRRMILTRIEKIYPEKHAALLSGMTIGYTENMDDNTKEAFSLSGISHIIAVSGAHVAFIAIPFLFVFKRLGLNIFVSNLLFLPILFFYAFVTGLEASVVRAVVMAGIGFLGTPLLRKPDILNTLCVSCILLLLYDPFMLLGVGFMLSYGATLGIVLILPKLRVLKLFVKLQGGTTDIFLSSFAATAAILPITVKYFYMFTPYSLIANMLIIPFTAIITVCGLLSVFLPLFVGNIIAYPVTAMLEFIMRITRGISELPGAKLLMNIPSDYQIAVYYMILYYLLTKKERKQKIKPKRIILVAVVILSVVHVSLFYFDRTQVTFIDVGQGDAIYIKTASNKVFLVDGGGSATYDVGQNIVIPFLLSRHAKKIDGLFSTHNDIDHIGGLVEVARHLTVKNAYLPYYYRQSESESVQSVIQNSLNVTYLYAGQIVRIDKDTSIKVLWPPVTVNPSDSSNHLSLVLLFQYKKFKVLLTGDLDEEGIRRMLSDYSKPYCTALKIPHHGGNNLEMETLIKHSAPDLAVISVGKNNRYGHPAPSVLDVLDRYGIPVLRTDQSGAITIVTNGASYSIRKYLN